MSAAPPYPATALPHIFKLATPESFPSLVATPGLGSAHRLLLKSGPSSWDGQQRPAGGVGFHLCGPPQGGKSIPTHCPASVRASDTPRSALNGEERGDTTEPRHCSPGS